MGIDLRETVEPLPELHPAIDRDTENQDEVSVAAVRRSPGRNRNGAESTNGSTSSSAASWTVAARPAIRHTVKALLTNERNYRGEVGPLSTTQENEAIATEIGLIFERCRHPS